MILTDWRGTPIRIGSRIVYPVTHSSAVTMVESVVVEIGSSPPKWSYQTNPEPWLMVERQDEHYYKTEKVEPKRVKINRVDRVTVVDGPSLTYLIDR